MSYAHKDLSVADKLFGQTELDLNRATMIKKTYSYLSLSVIAAMAGGYVGANSPLIINLFTGWIGWVLALVALNAIPYLAMACRHNPVLGLGALLLDGCVAGLVLGPILFFAEQISAATGNNLVLSAGLITGIVFLSVTGYVMTSKRRFSAPRGLMAGIFFGAIGLILLNAFMEMTLISLIISGAIGVIGVLTLIFATSDVLNNPEVDSPIPGALALFSGLFHVFIATLRILMAFSSRD